MTTPIAPFRDEDTSKPAFILLPLVLAFYLVVSNEKFALVGLNQYDYVVLVMVELVYLGHQVQCFAYLII